MKSKFPGAVHEIPVSNIDEALSYYQTKLGFNIDFGAGELGLAGISRGDCRMFLATAEFRKGYGNIGPVLTWLNLDSKEEVHELYESWNSNQARVISQPESKPWGLHEFTAEDPDGNLFRVFHDVGTAERGGS